MEPHTVTIFPANDNQRIVVQDRDTLLTASAHRHGFKEHLSYVRGVEHFDEMVSGDRGINYCFVVNPIWQHRINEVMSEMAKVATSYLERRHMQNYQVLVR